jgi:hypothetical protein
MHREWQLGGLAGSLDHSANAHAVEWMAALVHEDVRRFDAVEQVAAL